MEQFKHENQTQVAKNVSHSSGTAAHSPRLKSAAKKVVNYLVVLLR